MAREAHAGLFESLDVSGLIATYGLFLIIGGCWGALTTGAMHSLYGGVGGGALVFFCSFLASFSSDRKCVAAGVHLDLLLAALFAAVFAMQTYKAYGVPEKADRFPLFVILVLGSVSHLFAMIKLKPRKEKN